MGARGPIPNRDADLARPRSRKGGEQREVSKGELLPTSWPQADKAWHPIARKLWDGCKKSGQAAYYQQSDIAMLYSLCDDLSEYKKSTRRSSQMAQTIYSSLAALLVTEGERRRVRIELEAPVEPQASKADLAIVTYMEDLGVAE